jgi:hypothetical protein
VLRRYEVRGALNPERAALAFRRLLGLPVLLTGTTPLLEEAWSFGRTSPWPMPVTWFSPVISTPPW